MSEQTYKPSLGEVNARSQPIAVFQIAVLPDLTVAIRAEGQVNEGIVDLAFEGGRRHLLKKMSEAGKQPAIQVAPAGLFG